MLTLQHYFDGLFDGDVARLKEAFHPRATLFGEVKGRPYLKSLDEYLEVVAGRASPRQIGETARMRVLSVEREQAIAHVTAHCPMLGYNYIDHLSLLREDGRWRIVAKTFTHVEP